MKKILLLLLLFPLIASAQIGSDFTTGKVSYFCDSLSDGSQKTIYAILKANGSVKKYYDESGLYTPNNIINSGDCEGSSVDSFYNANQSVWLHNGDTILITGGSGGATGATGPTGIQGATGPTGASGSGLWESHLSGIKPVDDVSVYLTDLYNEVRLDSFQLGLAETVLKDSVISSVALGGLFPVLPTTVVGNNTDTLLYDDGLLFELDSISEGFMFSFLITLGDETEIDSFDIVLRGVETNALKGDESNFTPALMSSNTSTDTALYINQIVENAATELNGGGDFTLRCSWFLYDLIAESGSIQRDSQIRVTIMAADTNYIKIDAIEILTYYDGTITYPLGIDIDGKVVKITENEYEYIDTDAFVQTGTTVTFTEPDNKLVYLVAESSGTNDVNITSSSTDSVSRTRINAQSPDLASTQITSEVTNPYGHAVTEMTMKRGSIEMDIKMDSTGIIIGDSETGVEYYGMPYARGKSGQYLAMKSDFENGGDWQQFWHGGDSTIEEYYVYDITSRTASISGSFATQIVSDTFLYISSDSLFQLDIPSKGNIGDVLTSVDGNGTAEWISLFPPVDTISYVDTLIWDLGLTNQFYTELTGDLVVDDLTNLEVKTYVWFLKQDVTGSRLIDFSSSKFQFENGGTPPVLTTTPLALDMLTCISTGVNLICKITKDID